MAENPHSQPGIGARFSARFDNILMTAPQASAAVSAATTCTDANALAAALAALCQRGPRYASASHGLAATPALREQQLRWLQWQLLVLDGTQHMLSLGGPWRQRAHRLALKLRETVFSGAAAAGSPWDCGLLAATPAALHQAQRFAPRRPTLVVAWQLETSVCDALAATLQAREQSFVYPVRLWLLQAPLQRC